MRLLQGKKEETASLPVWLSRDVPHERKMAGELLDCMGRENSLDYLLRLHDKEETRRQKRLVRYYATIFSCTAFIMLLCGSTVYLELARSPHDTLPWLRVLIPLMWICSITVHVLNFRIWRGRSKKTPMFSSAVQQSVITALFNYADTPLLAEPFSLATSYYMGDRNRLYERLARILPLLPDDPEALTKNARTVLWRRLSPALNVRYAGEKERIPALRSAIEYYFARTGEAASRSERGLLRFRHK